MATNFTVSLNHASQDYDTLSDFFSQFSMNIQGTPDILVFSHSGITGTVADDASVTGSVSGATGTVIHATSTQILLGSITGTFQSSENIEVDASNYVTTTDAGDFPQITAEIYADDGDLSHSTVLTPSFLGTSDRYMEITSRAADRHDGTPNSGARVVFTGSGQGFNVGGDRRIYFTYLEFYMSATTGDQTMFYGDNGTGQDDPIIWMRNLIYGNVANTSGTVRGIDTASDGFSRDTELYNNIIFDCRTHGVYNNGRFRTNEIYNNTIANCGVGFENSTGSTSIADMRNNLFVGNTTNILPASTTGWSSSSINNMTDDTSTVQAGAVASGTTTATTTSKLVDSGATFASSYIGYVVKNTTDTTYAVVTAFDSTTQLDLSSDIFVSGESYAVYPNYGNASNTFVDSANDDWHLVSGDDAIDKGANIGTGLYDVDIDGRDRSTEGDTWDIGADEFVASGATVATPSLVPVTLTLFAPTLNISNSSLVNVNLVSVTVLLNAPTTQSLIDIQAQPNTASVTVSVFTPSLSVSNNAVATPQLGVVEVSLFEATAATSVLQNAEATPALTESTVTVFNATASTEASKSANVNADLTVVTLQTFSVAASVKANSTATPSLIEVILSVLEASASTGSAVVALPDTALFDIIVNSPSIDISVDRIVQPSPASISLEVFAASGSAFTESGITVHILGKSRIEKTILGQSRVEKYLTLESSIP